MNGKFFQKAFTIIELMIVMAMISLLLTIALPRYFEGLQRSKEAVLKEDLHVMRDALDKYYSDKGAYPKLLEDLVANKYIRSIPVDPLTEKNDTWVIVPPSDLLQGGVFDVHSGAEGETSGGLPYAQL